AGVQDAARADDKREQNCNHRSAHLQHGLPLAPGLSNERASPSVFLRDPRLRLRVSANCRTGPVTRQERATRSNWHILEQAAATSNETDDLGTRRMRFRLSGTGKTFHAPTARCVLDAERRRTLTCPTRSQ